MCILARGIIDWNIFVKCSGFRIVGDHKNENYEKKEYPHLILYGNLVGIH
jgi:hypothetical protein